MKERKFICVSCPLGCDLNVIVDDDGEVASVTGNSCQRGAAYARTEVKDPRRIFVSTVRVRGGRLPVCPIRSEFSVSREKIKEIARAIAKLNVKAPIKIGQVLIKNVCGTGVDIIASRDLSKQ